MIYLVNSPLYRSFLKASGRFATSQFAGRAETGSIGSAEAQAARAPKATSC